LSQSLSNWIPRSVYEIFIFLERKIFCFEWTMNGFLSQLLVIFYEKKMFLKKSYNHTIRFSFVMLYTFWYRLTKFFMCPKQFWLQDLSFNLMEATLNSDVSKVTRCRILTSWITSDYSKYQRGTLVAVMKRNRRKVWLVMCLLKTGRNLAFSLSWNTLIPKSPRDTQWNSIWKIVSECPYHYRAIYICWI